MKTPRIIFLVCLTTVLTAVSSRAQQPLGIGPVHRYSFTGAAGAAPDGTSIPDSAGTAHGAVRGAGATFTGTGLSLPGGASATTAYVDLPNGIASGSLDQTPGYASASYEVWVTVHGNLAYSRVLDFGANNIGEVTAPGGAFTGTDYLFVSANVGTAPTVRFERGGSGLTGGATQDSASATVLGQQVHLVATYDAASATWKLYKNGALLKTLSTLLGPDTLPDMNVWLGRSNWSGDANANATYDEFRIYNYALNDQQILGNYQTGPDVLTSTTLPAGWYQFDEASGTTSLDNSGGNPVTLFGGANFAAGVVGNALSLDGSTGYGRVANSAALNPTGAISLSAWIYPADWSGNRVIVQKGAGNTQYRLLAENGLLKFEIAGPVRSVTAALPATGAWSLVIATYDGAALRLYVNGAEVGSAAATGPIPTTTDDLFIGASSATAPTDEHFAGKIDDLRIYPRALSEIEIESLIGDPAVAIASPVAGTVAITGVPANLHLVADVSGSFLTGVQWSLVSGPTSVTFSQPTSADTTVRFTQTGRYVLQITANNAVGSATAQVTVGVKPAPETLLALWLKFNESSGSTATDSSTSARHATLVGGPTWTAGVLDNALTLDGGSQHATLPTGVTMSATNFSVSTWVKLDAVAAWSRIFDFGTGTTNCMFLTPSDGSAVRFVIRSASGTEKFITGSAPLPVGVWTHVAVTQFSSTAILYVNGVEVGRNSGMTISPSSLGNTTLNYLGKSQFASDPYLDGAMDDFRYYRRLLTPSEVAAFAIAPVAPTVSGGSAPAATNGVAAALNGSATVEAGTISTTLWSQVSGPGTASFENGSSPATGVTFSGAGTYVLRLTASNANAETFNNLTVNVATNPNLYADWAGSAYPGVTDEAVIGALADPDQDGSGNLLEWALGLNPAATDATVWSEGNAGLPTLGWWSDETETYLSLQVRRPIGRMGVTYSAEASGDLGTWGPAVQAGAPTANGDGSETVIFRDTVPFDEAASRRFMRLNVTQP